MKRHARTGAIAIAALSSMTSAGQQYYLTAGQNAIQKFDLDGNYLGDHVSPGGGLPGASQMTVSPDGSTLYVGTYRPQSNVAIFDARTGQSLGSLDNGGPLQGPSVVVFSKTGSLLVSDFLGGAVYEYDPDTRQRLGTFFTGVNLTNPHEILAFGDDYLVSDYGGNRIHRFDADGLFQETILGTAQGLGRPLDMLLSSDGSELFVSNNASGRISVYNTDDFSISRFIGSGRLRFPEGITWAADGSLVVANPGHAEILRFDALTGALLDTFEQLPSITQPSTDVLLVPAPGVAALAGLAGVAATRRRRS